ncbi:MAG TPA: flavin reductase family protein [Lacunisphaera sp.]|jgi:flavin reductase (DIM6/NTAB) family NADH-FMN oxidoreductase RutF
MILDLSQLPPRDAYRWMVNAITPRPIAWVSTISAAGKTNLAPFSFFQGVCAKPPTVIFCGANDRTGKKKDSVINVNAVPEFVVNLVPYALRESMNLTAATLPYGESEFEKFNIPTAAAQKVRPLRVADAPIAFECKLDRIVELGDGPLGSSVVFGTILCMHVNESILDGDGAIDPVKLDTIGRMGGDFYTRTTELFSMKRPD